MNNIFGKINNKELFLKNGYEKEIYGVNYTIVFDGEIYNKNALRNICITKGFITDNSNIQDILIYLYVLFNEEMLKYINGVFSFAILADNKLFIAKDRLGTRPLYYHSNGNSFIFSSRIKEILNEGIDAVLSRDELLEMFALGPAHNPSKTYFKDIYSLEAGNYITLSINENNLKYESKCYWSLIEKENKDTFDEILYNVKYLVTDSVQRQMRENMSSMLSGGLDSSIVVALAKKEDSNIRTFSINYEDNDIDFTPSPYQGTKDSDFVSIMNKQIPTKHKVITIDNLSLYNTLYESMCAREMPGMADVDSSLFCFCKKFKENGVQNIFSGECSDEIFGGYPWYYKNELQDTDYFPWARSQELREKLVKPGLLDNGEIKQYILCSKSIVLDGISHIGNDTFENNYKEINYLTLKYFSNTLLERGDFMSRANGINIHMPFADYRIFEYVYNIPAKTKLGIKDNTSTPIEKYVLKEAFKDILPNEIVNRKKSPFPKTYSKEYLKMLEDEITRILNNPDSKILEIINKEYVLDLVKSHGKELKENLFGQLMTYPQTLAYLIQIEHWLNEYNVKICIKNEPS